MQGVLTTEAAVGDVAAGMVLSSLLAYLAVYAALLAIYVGVLFHLARKDAGLLPPSATAAPHATPAE